MWQQLLRSVFLLAIVVVAQEATSIQDSAAPALDVSKGVPAAEMLVSAPSAAGTAAKVAVVGLTGYTFFPTPSPNVLAAFFALLLWIMIFLTGFCALFSVETPSKFVEKGLMMSKEY
ncbi:unnamed protein product [Amoebophrya sp. A120]|nr:unnamed protein product [Amoebophrya sp. A120]|eukprot:GSA120T00012576001.1